jgi:hypothetical protein
MQPFKRPASSLLDVLRYVLEAFDQIVKVSNINVDLHPQSDIARSGGFSKFLSP